MDILNKFYNLIKQEFSSMTYLYTCKEMYEKSQYRTQISNHLCNIGFKCPKDMEYALFFALVDIIVIVGSDNNFYFATFSEQKLIELKNLGRLLPKEDDLNFVKCSSIIEANTIDVINEALSRGKFHFIKINRVAGVDAFFCNISKMKSYPSLSNEVVYPVDILTSFYWGIVNTLIKGTYLINNSIICSLSLDSTHGKQLNKCPMTCKLYVKTVYDTIEELSIWDIKTIDVYASSKNLYNLLTGVCKSGDSYVTLNRDILLRYYGSSYIMFESMNVRERYCLEELFSASTAADLRYYVNKYGFYKDREICSCRNIIELKALLKHRLVPSKFNKDYVQARVLTSPNQIYAKYKSFYKTVSLDSDLEVVGDFENIMPQYYQVSGVCTLGYCVIDVKATSYKQAEEYGKKEFIRQFGNLYKDKILGLQKGKEVYKNRPVFHISLETQRRIAELIHWNYVIYFNDYTKYIRSIIDTLDISIKVSDDMIKYLLINPTARLAGKCRNVTLEIMGYCLNNFLTLLCTETQEQLEERCRNKGLTKS